MTLGITPDGCESFRVDVGMRDVLRWERTVRGASMGRLSKPSANDLYSLAWTACTHRELFVGDLAAFENACEVDAVAQDDVDPTSPAA